MKVTSVDMHAEETEIISFSLQDAGPSSRYLIKTIVGIDADELIPKFYGSGKITDTSFYRFSVRSRDIIMRVVLNPQSQIGESHSDIRDELYRAISSNRTGKITLNFNAGPITVAFIEGFITKFEVPYFSRISEVQITIRCDDPMFRGVAPVEFDSSGLSATNPVHIIDSVSTAPHGFEMQMTFTDIMDTFLIRNFEDSNWTFEVSPGVIGGDDGFIVGDVLTLSSELNDRQLYITRATVDYPLINKILLGSVWPVIFPGANEFHINDIAKLDWNYVKYCPAYWGV